MKTRVRQREKQRNDDKNKDHGKKKKRNKTSNIGLAKIHMIHSDNRKRTERYVPKVNTIYT